MITAKRKSMTEKLIGREYEWDCSNDTSFEHIINPSIDGIISHCGTDGLVPNELHRECHMLRNRQE